MSEASKLAALQTEVDFFAGAVPATPLASLPGWGSLAILLVILHCETTYGLAVTGAQVRACVTVGDLLKLIPEKQ